MPARYVFGSCEVRPVERELRIEGRLTPIGARAFDVLRVLVERRGELVTKQDLLDAVWPGLVVEEANLHVQVSAVRKLLGAKAVATIPGQGYRLALPVHVEGGAAGASAAERFAAGATPTAAGPRGASHGGPSAALPASAASLSATTTAAPPKAPDMLVGRDDELATLQGLLTQHRLVTVAGPAGIGKTRLAIAVARGEHAGNTWWVELAPLHAADLVLPAIASACGVTVPDGAGSDDLARALAACAGLLVLDNCEHLAGDVAAAVEAMLAHAPSLRVLATSQHALKIAGEQVVRLEPLAFPPAHVPLEAALCFGAVQLLEHRAHAADRRFRLDATTVDRAIDLCRDLDGIPLAIEMAAARLPLLGFDALVARLGDRLRLMRKDTRGTPARHQTLRAALDWSCALLDPAERAVLDRLSLFAGSFRLDLAQQVACDAALDEWTVLDAMAALVDKSLLQVAATEPPRYRLLESTRLYAAEHLATDAGAADARGRYVTALARLADEMDAAMWALSDRAWLARYGEDYADIEAAFDLAYELGRADDALALAMAVAAYSGIQLRASRKRRWRLEACHALLPQAGPRARARIWSLLSNTLLTLDNVSRLAAASAAVAAWRDEGDTMRLYVAHGVQAVLEAMAGDAAAARAALDAARVLSDPAWPPRVFATFAMHASRAYAFLHDAAAYRRELETMRDAAARGELDGTLAIAEVALADAALAAGDDAFALVQAQRGVDALRRMQMTGVLGTALANLACAQLLNAHDADARLTIAQAWPLLEQHDHAGLAFPHLCLLAARAGAWSAAAQLRGCADAWLARQGAKAEPGEARLLGLADALLDAQLDAGERAALQAKGAALNAAQAAGLAQAVFAARMEARDRAVGGGVA